MRLLEGGGQPQHHLVEDDLARARGPQAALAAALDQAEI